MLSFAVIALLGAGATALSGRGLSLREKEVVGLVYFAHLAAAVAQVLLTTRFFGGGDMLLYHRAGMFLADLLDKDFGTFAPEVWKLTLQDDFVMLPGGFRVGSATGSMVGVSAWIVWLVGDSLYAACAFLATLAALGKVAMYRGLRLRLPKDMRTVALYGCLVVPSFIFWSSGLVKEAVSVAGFGLVVLGSAMVAERRPTGAIIAGVAAVPTYLVKPYVMAAAVAALPIWILAARIQRKSGRVRGRHLFLIMAGAAVGLLVVGQVLPRFSLSEITSSLEGLQTVGARVRGGSTYSLGGSEEQGLMAQLLLAPLGLLSALFRPLPFEQGSLMVFVNGLETLVLSLLFLRSVVRLGPRQAAGILTKSPELIAATAFVVFFGTAVGLASTNLGTMSRYRAPMIPFWALIVLVLDRRAKTARSGVAGRKQEARDQRLPPRPLGTTT